MVAKPSNKRGASPHFFGDQIRRRDTPHRRHALTIPRIFQPPATARQRDSPAPNTKMVGVRIATAARQRWQK
jgi:hypothetical protein